MRPGEPSRPPAEAPFACPACRAGFGLPRHAAHAGPDRRLLALRCHACGHEWDLDRGGVQPQDHGEESARCALSAAATVVHPIAACRACAGLMTLDVALAPGQPPCASGYTCPHCGAAGEVSLPGASVRQARAVGSGAAAVA